MDLTKPQEEVKQVARKGSMLEELVENIFQNAGFEVKRNIFVSGYEIDILAVFGDRTIIVECKQYEKSYLPVKNLILQWKGKNEAIKADAVILVIYGIDISEEETSLAVSCGIKIWGMEELNAFLGLINNQEQLSSAILDLLQLRERDIAETNATDIKQLIIRSLLKNQIVPEHEKYNFFRGALRNRIITNLKESGSTTEIRKKHVDFFEIAVKDYQTALKQVRYWWFGWSTTYKKEIRKLNHKEVWMDIKNKLETIKPFAEETNNRYLNYINRLEQGFGEYYDWFVKDIEYRNKRLISERIQALGQDEYVRLQIPLKENSTTIRVYRDSIALNQHAISSVNVLEWILTDRFHEVVDIKDQMGNVERQELHWFTGDIENTIEFVCRMLHEYYGLKHDAVILDITPN